MRWPEATADPSTTSALRPSIRSHLSGALEELGKGGNSLMVVTCVPVGVRGGEGVDELSRDKACTDRAREISNPPKVSCWPAALKICRLFRPSRNPIETTSCPPLLRRSTHTFTQSSLA